jgi:hypothetical protein
MKECVDCMNDFNETDGRPWKYEPSVWLCDDCSSERMAEDDRDDDMRGWSGD